MSNAIVNISLSAKQDPTVNITVESSGIISSPSSNSPIISFVATGESGPVGPQGNTGSATGGNSINQTHIADDSVGTDQIIDGSVTYSKLGVNSVYASKIAANAITTTKLANNSVTNSKLSTNSVTADKIAPGTITRELIEIFGDGAIEPDKLKPKSITSAEIQDTSLQASLFIDRSITAIKIESNADLDGEVKAHNLKLKGSSPATLTGPDSHALQIKSNTTIDFQNTSNTTIASLDQNGNLTLSGTVDGIDIATDVAANSLKTGITTAQANAIIANTAKQTNVSTNLSVSPGNSDFIINSSDGTNASLPAVSTTNMGIMTPADKTKLDGISTGATANVGDVTLTGTQTISGNKILNNLRIQNEESDGTPDIRFYEGSDNGTNYATLKAADSIASNYEVSLPSSAGTIALTSEIPVDLTVDGAGTVHANNYTNTTYSEATSASEGLMSTAHHDKLDGIESGAEVNVQSNWSETDNTSDSFIQNKPTIPAAYTDSDAVSAVEAATIELANDLTVNSNFIYLKDQSGSGAASRFNTATLTANRTLTMPDASGTIAIAGNAGQVIQVSLRDHVDYMFYMFHQNNWYAAGASTLAVNGTGSSPSNITAANSEYQSRVAAYTAVENCVLEKMILNFYWSSSAISGDIDIEFAFSKFTPIQDGTAAIITMNDITATNCDDAYTEAKPYQKTFTFSGNNATLSAGDAFSFHMRTINSQSSQRVLVYASAVLQLKLT